MTTSRQTLECVRQSSKADRLIELAQRAVRLGEGRPKERVAVPNPKGGYHMEVRVIKTR